MVLQIYLLSGTPGTGKTTLAKYLEKEYRWKKISLGEEVKKKSLYSHVDEQRNTKVVDLQKFRTYFQKKFANLDRKVIIEGHYADMIQHPKIKLGIILRCHPKILTKRLKKRNYSQSKINENVEAELLGDSTSYMLEKGNLKAQDRIFELDTSYISLEKLGYRTHEIILHPDRHKKYLAGKISWLSDPSVDLTKYQTI